MTDTNKLKELAERAVDDFGSFDPSEAEQEFMEQITPQDVLGLIAEVERLRNLEARQQEITDHYKKWFKEIVYESFDEWLKDDATHWIGEEDAALQAWQHLHENKIWLMKERIEEHEQERDQLKAENEALRKDAERYRFLKDQGHFRAMSIDMGGNHVWTGMGRSVGRGQTVDEAIDAAIDAALEGGGR